MKADPKIDIIAPIELPEFEQTEYGFIHRYKMPLAELIKREIKQSRDEAIELCAKTCEDFCGDHLPEECAEAIRKLKEKDV